jgi:hypothetical protein
VIRSTEIEKALSALVDGIARELVKPGSTRKLEDQTEKQRKPRKAVDMACRAPRCTERSKGPRFRYLCEKHRAKPRAAA